MRCFGVALWLAAGLFLASCGEDPATQQLSGLDTSDDAIEVGVDVDEPDAEALPDGELETHSPDTTTADAQVDGPTSLPGDAVGSDSGPSHEVLRLDELAEAFRVEHSLPGVGIIAFDMNKVLGLGVAGLRWAAGNSPIEDQDKFHLGSCTKAMTATLAAKLDETGELSLDANLQELFPDVKVHVELQAVTVRQLLRHEGGVYSSLGAQAPDLWSSLWAAGDTDLLDTRREFAESVLTTAPPHSPGAYSYSNTGYILVGAAIEQALGMTWESVIEEQLFQPFGMEGCGFGAPGDVTLVDQPWGHRQKNGQSQGVPPGPQADNPPALGPAGTVHCPLGSWAKFMMGHLGGGPPGFLSEASWSGLHSTEGAAGNYALGWLVIQGGALQHFGSNTMNLAGAWLYPGDGVGYAIVTNTGPASAFMGPMGDLVPLIAEALEP